MRLIIGGEPVDDYDRVLKSFTRKTRKITHIFLDRMGSKLLSKNI
jgi:hypothetical protein